MGARNGKGREGKVLRTGGSSIHKHIMQRCVTHAQTLAVKESIGVTVRTRDFEIGCPGHAAVRFSCSGGGWR